MMKVQQAAIWRSWTSTLKECHAINSECERCVIHTKYGFHKNLPAAHLSKCHGAESVQTLLEQLGEPRVTEGGNICQHRRTKSKQEVKRGSKGVVSHIFMYQTPNNHRKKATYIAQTDEVAMARCKDRRKCILWKVVPSGEGYQQIVDGQVYDCKVLWSNVEQQIDAC